MLYDFHVREPKSYSFFLEEELCEIDLEQRDDRFYYTFNINKSADTPRNRVRKATEKLHWRQSAIFFGSLVACVALAVILFLRFDKKQDEVKRGQILSGSHKTELGKIEAIEVNDDVLEVSFAYRAKGQVQRNTTALPLTPYQTLEHGMPLETGDEFLVAYARENPDVGYIDFNQPSEPQINLYFRKAVTKHTILHPELRPRQINCLANAAFSLKGIEGLADFYFQDTPVEENPEHNELTFNRLVRDLPFQKLAKDCALE
ncbi:MAG: hypothetical protein DHS20C18_36690 [Saprospiraceae bacterium]|nr:MAG: hypothetical protein DHS20C18_36690 [Saprospiraceae bacterium]